MNSHPVVHRNQQLDDELVKSLKFSETSGITDNRWSNALARDKDRMRRRRSNYEKQVARAPSSTDYVKLQTRHKRLGELINTSMAISKSKNDELKRLRSESAV